MRTNGHAYADIYQVLAGVCFKGASPAGGKGSLYNAIDKLRHTAAPAEHIEIAEQISIAIHRLDWAMLREDEREESAMRDELRKLGASWRETPIPVL